MANGLQINLNVLRVSRLFLSSTGKRRCGFDVARTLGLKVSTAYNVLYRMQDAQWVSSIQEAQKLDGRPGSRLYNMTPIGVAKASAAFAALQMAST